MSDTVNAVEKKENDDRVNPIRITDKLGTLGKAGEVYELDFSRESAVYATDHGIDIGEENTSERLRRVPDLFYCAFRKNHKMISREKIDKLRKANKGLTTEFINRLYALLSQALAADVINVEDGEEKNAAMDVEL